MSDTEAKDWSVPPLGGYCGPNVWKWMKDAEREIYRLHSEIEALEHEIAEKDERIDFLRGQVDYHIKDKCRINSVKSMDIVELRKEIEALRNGDVGFREFETIARGWLTKYPPSVFDGSSGDPGPLFVVALREAIDVLPPEPES